MDPVTLFTISTIITAALFGILIYFMQTRFNKLKTDPNADKKDEILTKWLDAIQTTMETRLKNVEGTMDNRLKDVREQLDKSSNTLNQRVDESAKNMNVRLDKAADVIGKVQKELGSMSEIGRGMKDLQDFLRSPKLRGNIGEEVLKDLLEQMIPSENYILQHTFKNGDRVDALLKVEEGYISVDSKFPMEHFNAMMQGETKEDRDALKKTFERSVKKHVEDISKKYILPNEGTVDFALMYIPSEAIYYEVVVNSGELGKYCWQKRVLPVSPNVFYSYLKAILIGLEGKKVETRAKEILYAIRQMKEDANKFGESLRVLTKHVSNAHNMADEATRKFEKLGDRIGTIDNIRSLSEGKEKAEDLPGSDEEPVQK